ncbi:MAG: efflux RND transporter periplasmic adaptor subunit [Draconibacterium sp.]|nr:efflux RND transporter periplasmic adaptor subunit [Draconibacterium sp.]
MNHPFNASKKTTYFHSFDKKASKTKPAPNCRGLSKFLKPRSLLLVNDCFRNESNEVFGVFLQRLFRKILPVFIAGIVLFACQPTPKTQSVKAKIKVHIKTAKVFRGDITDTISIFGELALRQEAWLSSQFEGRLTDFALLKGDKVEKGQLAGIIVPARREALLQAAENISDELKPLLDEQEKSIPLYYPVTGVVLDVRMHTGDVVAKGEHIVHIGDLRILDVQGELPVQYLETARKAKMLKVQFTNYIHPDLNLPIETFTANVTANQSLIIRLKLNNPSLKFRPGMRVKITFPTPVHKEALLLPRSALVEEEGQYFVFTIENGKTTKHHIETGIMHNDYVEIISGVEENQLVAVEKAYSLKDNLEVITD